MLEITLFESRFESSPMPFKKFFFFFFFVVVVVFVVVFFPTDSSFG